MLIRMVCLLLLYGVSFFSSAAHFRFCTNGDARTLLPGRSIPAVIGRDAQLGTMVLNHSQEGGSRGAAIDIWCVTSNPGRGYQMDAFHSLTPSGSFLGNAPIFIATDAAGQPTGFGLVIRQMFANITRDPGAVQNIPGWALALRDSPTRIERGNMVVGVRYGVQAAVDIVVLDVNQIKPGNTVLPAKNLIQARYTNSANSEYREVDLNMGEVIINVTKSACEVSVPATVDLGKLTVGEVMANGANAASLRVGSDFDINLHNCNAPATPFLRFSDAQSANSSSDTGLVNRATGSDAASNIELQILNELNAVVGIAPVGVGAHKNEIPLGNVNAGDSVNRKFRGVLVPAESSKPINAGRVEYQAIVGVAYR